MYRYVVKQIEQNINGRIYMLSIWGLIVKFFDFVIY